MINFLLLCMGDLELTVRILMDSSCLFLNFLVLASAHRWYDGEAVSFL